MSLNCSTVDLQSSLTPNYTKWGEIVSILPAVGFQHNQKNPE